MEDIRQKLIDYTEWIGLNPDKFDNLNDQELVDEYLESINKAPGEAQAVIGNEQEKEVSFSCNCVWPQCNHLSNCREPTPRRY